MSEGRSVEDSKDRVLSLDSSVASAVDSSGNQLFCSAREVLAEKHAIDMLSLMFSLI